MRVVDRGHGMPCPSKSLKKHSVSIHICEIQFIPVITGLTPREVIASWAEFSLPVGLPYWEREMVKQGLTIPPSLPSKKNEIVALEHPPAHRLSGWYWPAHCCQWVQAAPRKMSAAWPPTIWTYSNGFHTFVSLWYYCFASASPLISNVSYQRLF